MDDLQRLVAIEDIKVLKAQYFRFVDTKDWASLRSLFTDDAEMSFPENFEESFAPDAFIEMVTNGLSNAITEHHGHMPEITIESDDSATGIWAMYDHLYFPSDEAGLTGASEITGTGHYHDVYRKVDNRWLIASTHLTRLRLQSIRV